MPNDVINTVTIHGTTYDIGGSGGGHTIKNPAGTAMTQRSNLQFVDLTVSDDSTNDATKVESVHVIQSESELENLPDGLYMLNDDEDTVIDGNLVGYDNTNSGLNAENVQDAIDEVAETLDDKADKVSSATNGNLAGLNGLGNLTDSGWNGAKDTTSISGNPISITGLKSNQLAKNPIITLEPIQAGSGTPSPDNIREISGYDNVEVLSCGKNIWADGDISGTRLVQVNLTIPLEPGTYKISAIVTTQDTQYDYCLMFDPINNVSVGSMPHSTGNQRVSTTMHIVNKCALITFYAAASWASSADKTFSYKDIQIEKSNTVTDYTPYNKATSISESLGQTVYGGSLDVRTGKFTVTYNYLELDGSSDENWSLMISGSFLLSGITPQKTYYAGIPAPISDYYLGKIIGGWNDLGDYEFAFHPTNYNNVRFNDSRYTTLDAWKAHLQSNPIRIVYLTNVPTEIQLTPHEISLLKDYAYVSTNGTTIALDYHNGELASLADVSQLGETVNAFDRIQEKQGQVNIISYNSSSNRYSIPFDGYITAFLPSGIGYVRVTIYDHNEQTMGIYQKYAVSSGDEYYTVSVKKGMKAMVTASSGFSPTVTYRGMV